GPFRQCRSVDQADVRGGQRPDAVHRCVTELRQRLDVDVADGVAGGVEARVVVVTGGATVDGRLVRGLDVQVAAEQATDRDAHFGQRAEREAVERVREVRLRGQPDAGEVVAEDAGNGVRRRVRTAGDEPDVVRRT